MYNEQGQPLSVAAPVPAVNYPNIPPPVQTSPASSPIQQMPVQLAPPALDEVPLQFHAMLLDGLRKGVTPAAAIAHLLAQYTISVTELAVRKVASTYSAMVFNGATWETPFPPLQGAPVTAVAADAAPPPSSSSAANVRTRLKEADRDKIKMLLDRGMDSSAIAQELGLAPDAVMRALKKLMKAAASPPPLAGSPAPQASAPVPSSNTNNSISTLAFKPHKTSLRARCRSSLATWFPAPAWTARRKTCSCAVAA
jgi:hypothetical protein